MSTTYTAMQEYSESLKKSRDKFITDRTMQEQTFNKWVNQVKQWPDEVKAQLPFDPEIMILQNLVPAWYSDTGTEEEAKQQIDILNQYIEAANQIVMQINEKAMQAVANINNLGDSHDNSGI